MTQANATLNLDPKSMKIVFVGAGVIGGSVGGWVAQKHENVWFLDQGPVQQALKEKGITLYEQGKKESPYTVPVKVIDDLSEVPDADVVVIGVKNYSLDAVAKIVQEKFGDRPIIVGMQNGFANQQILPKYFSKVIYCVVSYNAWMDEPAVIGYQKKGPLHFGVLVADGKSWPTAVAKAFNKGVETHYEPRIQDAIHCKIVINLANSITTLVGHTFRPIKNRKLFQKLVTNMAWEGVKTLKAAGFKESKLGGMPSWLIIGAGANLPRIITRPLFEKNVKKMVVSSMAQDVIQRGAKDSELETINGYILKLAEKNNVPVPYNKTVYDLCLREFSKEKFEPLTVEEVWEAVKRNM